MSNFSYDDFAVLVRTFSQNMLDPESLRIVPLSAAPSMADAIRGTSLGGTSLEGLDSELNLPKQKNGNVVRSNVTVQHDSAGYCRLVGHIEAKADASVKEAKAFVLYHLVKDGSGEKPEVIAVASLKEGFEIGDVCYPSFTITTVNNYQSVAFNPNAFATVEDLKNINGLDGLHIAFDTASGDLKLLDKDGNVLDQANLPIKADVIIADGEEGYKYVKTDVKQDIHAAKAWMPKDQTAWEYVPAVGYIRQHAALVVGNASTPASRVFVEDKIEKRHPISTESVQFDHVVIDGSTYMVADKNEPETKCSLLKVKGNAEAPTAISEVDISGVDVTHGSQTYTITNDPVKVDVIKSEDGLTTYVLAGTNSPVVFQPRSLNGGSTQLYTGTIVTSGGSSAGGVVGITIDGQSMYTFEEGATTPSEFKDISGYDVTWFGTKPIPEGYTLKYGLEAFVWTVKDAEAGKKIIDPFFQQLNASLLALGFHEGDDIALGTNLAELAPADGVSPLSGVDADDYMHGETKNELGKTNKELREQEVDEQRKFAKDELVAWNAQHPELTHDGTSGTRISKDGLDVRNGKIEIGNGVANADEQHSEDNVKRYVIETDIGDDSVGARTDKGLQIGVIDSVQPNSSEPMQKDILTINAEDYISGAPTCLALLKCSKSGDLATVFAGLEGGRITANFTAEGTEDASNGVFTLTITDNRANNGFGSAHRIVEIIPVYKSGADDTEAVPAQRSISAIALAETNNDGKSTLSIQCSQVIDWAQSIDLGGTVSTTQDDPDAQEVPPESGIYVKPNGMELYLIVKVY